MGPLASYLIVEVLLLVAVRFTQPSGVWLLLSGFLLIGFVGALIFAERPLENSKALVTSSGIVFAVLWLYIFGTLAFATASDPGIVPPAVRDLLRHNLAGNLLGALLEIVAAMCTSWMICVLLAIVGNTLGAKLRRLLKPH
ncbi:MAG TPA: hypothetical protein VKU60_09875 [Chloroflexota bacterium]|nr:hypothetical protein [Chloroflexota bacterium]